MSREALTSLMAAAEGAGIRFTSRTKSITASTMPFPRSRRRSFRRMRW